MPHMLTCTESSLSICPGGIMLLLDELHDVDADLDSIELGSPSLDLLVGICPQVLGTWLGPSGTTCVLISHLRDWIDEDTSCTAIFNG